MDGQGRREIRLRRHVRQLSNGEVRQAGVGGGSLRCAARRDMLIRVRRGSDQYLHVLRRAHGRGRQGRRRAASAGHAACRARLRLDHVRDVPELPAAPRQVHRRMRLATPRDAS
eukprot:5865627-Prymnesium_polylepis.2